MYEHLVTIHHQVAGTDYTPELNPTPVYSSIPGVNYRVFTVKYR